MATNITDKLVVRHLLGYKGGDPNCAESYTYSFKLVDISAKQLSVIARKGDEIRHAGQTFVVSRRIWDIDSNQLIILGSMYPHNKNSNHFDPTKAITLKANRVA